jgi:hypothetical protein
VGTVHIWELGIAVGALVCVALLLALGVRRQRALLAAFAMTALVTVGGVALMTSQLPSTSGFVVRAAAPANNLAWVLAAVLVWVTIVGGFTHVVATDINAVRVGIQLIHRRRRLVAALGAATLTVVVVGSAAVTPLDPSDDPGSILWGPARLHAAAIDDAILPATPVVLEVEPDTNAAFRLMVPTLVGQLQVRGIDAYYRAAWPGGWLPGLIPRYEVTTAPPGAASVVLRIGPHALDEVAGYTRLSSYDPANPPPRYSANDTPLLRYGREPTAVDLAPDAERSAE